MSHAWNRPVVARGAWSIPAPVALGLALFVALFVGLAAPSAARSEETGAPGNAAHDSEGHAEGHEADHSHHAHTIHGEPPRGLLGKGTEFLAIDPILFFWTLGVFVVTALLLRNFAWKPIIEALEWREHKIAESLAKAETIRAQTQALLAEQDAELTKAHEEAKRILEEARAQATAQSESILTEARDLAAKAQAEAQAKIDQASSDAVARLRESTAALSATLAGKLARKTYDPSEFTRLVEETSP